MSLSLVIFLKLFFALKVNIYLQNMTIKRRLAIFDQKLCIFVVFLFFLGAALSPRIINYACLNFRTAWQWHWCSYFSTSFNSQRFLQFLL